MKQLFVMLALCGVCSINVYAQDHHPVKTTTDKSSYTPRKQQPRGKAQRGFTYEMVDTTILSSDGSSVRFFAYSSSGSVDIDTVATVRSSGNSWGFFPIDIRRSFEEAQELILRQTESDAVKFNKWMSEQRAAQSERVKQQWKDKKVAIFTEYMGLTEAESQRFWPIYNIFSEKRDNILQKRMKLTTRLRSAELNIDSKEADELSRDYVNSLTQEADLQQDFYRRFKLVLPSAKLLMLYKAEDAFKLMLLQSRQRTMN